MAAHENLSRPGKARSNRQCGRCGATIHLVKGGADRKGVEWFRWVTNPKRPQDSWKCQPTAEWPVRSHSPNANPNSGADL